MCFGERTLDQFCGSGAYIAWSCNTDEVNTSTDLLVLVQLWWVLMLPFYAIVCLQTRNHHLFQPYRIYASTFRSHLSTTRGQIAHYYTGRQHMYCLSGLRYCEYSMHFIYDRIGRLSASVAKHLTHLLPRNNASIHIQANPIRLNMRY